MKRLIPVLFFFLALWGCQAKPRIHKFEGPIMGTYYSVKVVGENVNEKELGNEIKKNLERLNEVFSTYDSDSELSKINQSAKGKKITLSSELAEVLASSKKIASNTGGYFDVTVGPIVNAWGFGPDGRQKRPTERRLKELGKNVGMELFELEDGTLVKKYDGVYIDLSAIAKGYAVDKTLELLHEKGYESALVEIGGEVRTSGRKTGGQSWLLGIEKPSEKLGAGIQAVVRLDDKAMATSGSYRNYVKYGDQVFSHTIDPIKRSPALNNVISVTVLADTCAKADAYATAFMAMGHEKGVELAKKLGLPAYFIVKKGSGTAIISTETFAPYILEK